MLPDRVSNRGPLTYESDALPIALRIDCNLVTSGVACDWLKAAPPYTVQPQEFEILSMKP